MKADLKAERKPILCDIFTHFKSKYTFDMGNLTKEPDPTLTRPATYKDIKQSPNSWILKSP